MCVAMCRRVCGSVGVCVLCYKKTEIYLPCFHGITLRGALAVFSYTLLKLLTVIRQL